jgi:hypothetical protein
LSKDKHQWSRSTYAKAFKTAHGRSGIPKAKVKREERLKKREKKALMRKTFVVVKAWLKKRLD